MKVIGWTGWDDPRYPDDYGDDPLLEERKKVVVEELRKHIKKSRFIVVSL